MIKIKEGSTQIEILGANLEGKQSLMVTIDDREIMFSSVSDIKLEDEEGLEEEEEKEDDGAASEPEPEPAKKVKRISNAKKYTKDKLFEDLLELCCELVRFPRTTEIVYADIVSYNTYFNRMGNISNIIDKLGHRIKSGKVTDKMTQIMCDFCTKHDLDIGWEFMWEKLVENTQESSGHKPRGISQTKQIMRGER